MYQILNWACGWSWAMFRSLSSFCQTLPLGVNAATGSAEQMMLQESQAVNPGPSFGNQHCACLWIRSPDNLLHIWMLLSYTALFLFQFLKAFGKYPFVSSPHHLFCQKDQRCNGWEWAGCKPVYFAPVYLTWICHCHGCAGFILSCCNQRERKQSLISDGHNHMKREGDTCLSWMCWG